MKSCAYRTLFVNSLEDSLTIPKVTMLRFVFIATAILSSGFSAVCEGEEYYFEGKQHYRATLRHIESGGIGYQHGYTTLEAFLAPDPSQRTSTPFLDARGHIFDNGKWAANVGVGLRTLWGTRAYGMNAYYDYRNTGRFNSNQIGAGIETLGQLLDFRINGYFPVGPKLSDTYDSVFEGFSGHYMLTSQKIQSAMKGADAEFGFHLGKTESFDFYAAAGPYYFIGDFVPATWGGKARLSGTFKDFLTLEISDSYDRTFHNKFQGQIGFNFSLGPKSKVKERGCSCKIATILNDRMLQPVNRQEIIVIDNVRKNTFAIDPDTGLPYYFVFVNNTSSSNGTFESPYPTLIQAQDNSSPNNIIYVFAGDGTTRGMDSGIFLQASQKFWGSGVSHLLQTTDGAILIPALSSTSPIITNTNLDTDGNAVTLATNNAISGFTIASTSNDAIFGTNPQSLDVSFCTFQHTSRFPINATFPGNAFISLTNNQFLNNVNGVFLTLNGASTVICSENTFQGQTSSSSIPIEIASNNVLAARFERNVFTFNFTGSMKFDLHNAATDILLLSNTFSYNGTGLQSPGLASNVVIFADDGTINDCSIVLNNNTFFRNAANSLYMNTSGAFTTIEVTATSNTMSENGASAIVIASPVDTLTLIATDNMISRCNDHGITTSDSPSQTANITISNNTITEIGNTQSGIAISKGSLNLNFTAENNTIGRCSGSGILFFSNDGFTNMTANIIGNTITECLNGSPNAASGISVDSYVNLISTVENNTLLNDTSPSVAFGAFASGSPTVCLNLTGNFSNINPSYSLTNPVSGTFNLSPCNVSEVNTGTFSNSGIITPVVSCPEATVCP